MINLRKEKDEEKLLGYRIMKFLVAYESVSIWYGYSNN